MPASRRPLLKASAAARRKANSLDSVSCDLAAQDGRFDVHQREAERAAAFAQLAEHFHGRVQVRRRQLLGHLGSGHHDRLRTGRKRLHADREPGPRAPGPPSVRRHSPVTSTACWIVSR